MAHLTLAGVSADGRRLLLVDAEGAEFTLEITPELRAALRGGTTRTATLEIQMSSSLRPREIQSRIRAGEAPEAVAEAAGTTVDAIMSFVAPVLAEREHVAERAQRSSVRRVAGDGAGAPRALGEAVAAHLRSNDARPDSVSWDAYRRDDGRWVLTAAYETTRRAGQARFAYDAPGNYVLAENDDARWLIGDLAAAPPAPAPSNDLEKARQRRMAATSGYEELPLGDDAIDLVTGEAADALAEPLPPRAPEELVRDTAPHETAAVDDAEGPDLERGRQRRAVQKKRGRASVPSWDEIMFGSSD